MRKFAVMSAALLLLFCFGHTGYGNPHCLCRLYEIEENPDGSVLYAADEHAADSECANPEARFVNDAPRLGGQICEEETCEELAAPAKSRPRDAVLSEKKSADYQLQVDPNSGLKVIPDLTKVVRFWVRGAATGDDHQILARIFVLEGDPARYPGKPKPPYRLIGIGYEIEVGPGAHLDFDQKYSASHIKKVKVDSAELTHQFDLRLGNMTYRIITTPKP